MSRRKANRPGKLAEALAGLGEPVMTIDPGPEEVGMYGIRTQMTTARIEVPGAAWGMDAGAELEVELVGFEREHAVRELARAIAELVRGRGR